MSRSHQVIELKRSRLRAPTIQAINLADLAGVADALVADGRSDLAAQILVALYYCAERQSETANVVPLFSNRHGKP